MGEVARVWCSNLMLDPEACHEIDIGQPPPWPAGHWARRGLTCETIEPDELPQIFRFEDMLARVPEAFAFQGGLIVGQRVKRLLESFSLGATQFLRIRLTSPFRTAYARPFYLMNIAECRALAVPEQCAWAVLRANGGWTIGDGGGRLDLAVRGGAPAGFDLWLDPALRGPIFLSPSLAVAIRAAEIANFAVFPCREAR